MIFVRGSHIGINELQARVERLRDKAQARTAVELVNVRAETATAVQRFHSLWKWAKKTGTEARADQLADLDRQLLIIYFKIEMKLASIGGEWTSFAGLKAKIVTQIREVDRIETMEPGFVQNVLDRAVAERRAIRINLVRSAIRNALGRKPVERMKFQAIRIAAQSKALKNLWDASNIKAREAMLRDLGLTSEMAEQMARRQFMARHIQGRTKKILPIDQLPVLATREKREDPTIGSMHAWVTPDRSAEHRATPVGADNDG